ncbi:MAG: branched-chain amino acid ABC transporter permease [Azospirillaceae bacterium]
MTGADLAILALDVAGYVLILTLVALGLAIIFGLLRVISMAHGEFLMLGAYLVLVVEGAGGSFWLGLALAGPAVALVGLLVEAVVIRRVYRRLLDTILATWGVSLVIRQAVTLVFGPASHSIDLPVDAAVAFPGFEYPVYRLFIMALSLALVGATAWLFFATRFGLAARAVIADRDMAACLGYDTRAFDRATFAYGSALAGVAGAAMAPLISVDPQMGVGFLVPAFLSVLVGGLGSIAGPLAGAGTLGAIDGLVARALSPVWAQVAVLAIAVVLIRLFPKGLLGRRGRSP